MALHSSLMLSESNVKISGFGSPSKYIPASLLMFIVLLDCLFENALCQYVIISALIYSIVRPFQTDTVLYLALS